MNTRSDSSPDAAAGLQPNCLLALIGDIFESLPVALIVSNAGRRIILANREVEVLLAGTRPP